MSSNIESIPFRVVPPLTACLAVGLAALSFHSQAGAPGVIVDGNARYALHQIASDQTDSVDADFTADAAGIADVLGEHWWYVRLNDDRNERPLRDDGNLIQRYTDSHADLRWPDLDGRGLVSVHLGIDVISTGPRSGLVYSRLRFVNISRFPVRLNVYQYVDADGCDPSLDEAVGTGPEHLVVGSCPTQSVESWAFEPYRVMVASASDSEVGLRDPGIAYLNNGGLPFGPGDYSAASHWRDYILLPGAFHTYTTQIRHNPGPCGRGAQGSDR